MSLFIGLAVLAALLFATASILLKHVLDLGVKDCVFRGSIYSWPFFLGFMALGIYNGGIALELPLVLLSAVAGALYAVVLIYYLKGLESDEASRFIPVLSINTVFLAILSYLFLGESFSAVEYLGMGLAVIGAIMISIEDVNHLKKLHSKIGTLIAVSVAVVQASRDLIVEFVTQTVQLWPMLFWMGAGGFLFSSTVLLVKKRQKLGISQVSRQRAVLAVGGLHASGYILYASAISIGAAAKASAILRLNPLFVFLGATAIAFLLPDFIDEETDWKKILQKLVASIVIIIGVLLVR